MMNRPARAADQRPKGLRARSPLAKLNPQSSKDPVLVGKPVEGSPSDYTVVIFGLPRGGTTMVAGVVQKLGLWIGDDLGSNLEDAAFDRKPVEEMREAINQRNGQRRVWGWKFPAAARYLPQLMENVRNPRFIVVWRDPLTASLRKLNHVRRKPADGVDFFTQSLEVMASRIAQQQLNIQVLRQFDAPTLHVSYEKAVRHPEEFIRSLASFIGIAAPEDLSDIVSFMAPESYKGVTPGEGEAAEAAPAKAPPVRAVAVEPAEVAEAPRGPAAKRPGAARAAAKEAGLAQDVKTALENALLRPKKAAAAPEAKAKRKPIGKPPKGDGGPITMAPRPLVNTDAGLTVLWSPKSACTTTYVWFAHVSGFSNEVREYAAWPHKHRQEVFNLSALYERSILGDHMSNKVLRVIRDPYSRAVSIYRHALQTHFADSEVAKFQGGAHSLDRGMSFQDFLDMLATLNMQAVDIHFRPQYHPYEEVRKADVVINISKQDLFTELNRFEEQNGYPRTNFSDLDWLKKLEHKRKAGQDEMQGDALDTVAFNKNQVSKLHQFPRYDQLLTPEARQKIESIYKIDFDAYSDFF